LRRKSAGTSSHQREEEKPTHSRLLGWAISSGPGRNPRTGGYKVKRGPRRDAKGRPITAPVLQHLRWVAAKT
jgi:hypothetical protein